MAEPLRVLHLDGGLRWAGGQNQARLLMVGLRERGHHQLMLCPRGSPTEERLRIEGLPVRGIPWRGPLDLRAMWAAARARIPSSGTDGGAPPRIVHCHDAHALQVAIPPARLVRRGLVATRRIHLPTSPLKWNRAHRVVAISGVVASALRQAGVHPDRIRTVPSGVDPDELASLPSMSPPLRRRLGLGDDAFLVGNVGHLVPVKGQIVIPRAASILPGSHWVVVGEGPERATLETEIRALGVEDRVRLAGLIPDARRVLRELDLFVFPSLSEALGTSVLDAMFLGVPVVAADRGGPAEILGPVYREVGVGLVHPDDPPALVRAVERLRDDPALRERLVEAQLVRARDYTARAMVEGTLAVYGELDLR